MNGLSYQSTQPNNNRDTYSPLDQIDWLVKIRPGYEIVANSLRITGILKTVTTTIDASNNIFGPLPVTPEQCVFLNPYGGAHTLFRSFQSTCAGNIVENIVQYARYASMMKQANNTLTTLSCSTRDSTELCGVKNNHQIVGEVGVDGCSFSIQPMVALNRTSANIQSGKFSVIRLQTQLSAALECFYTTSGQNNLKFNVNSINYSLSKLLLQWHEVPTMTLNKEPMMFQNIFLCSSSIVSKLSNITLQSPNQCDAVFTSFIAQKHQNKLDCDNNLSEYVPQINRMEWTINSFNNPLNYAIQNNGNLGNCYPDIGLNFAKALNAGPKNSVMNLVDSEHWAFGIGCAFSSGISDKITQTMTISDLSTGDEDPSVNPLQAYSYLNTYVYL